MKRHVLLVVIVTVACSCFSTLLTAAPTEVKGDKGDAQSWLDRARLAASRDRHGVSIFYYGQALAADSTIGPGIGKELGDQYTWADKPDSAVAWYELYLDHHPDDIDAELGLARALSWSNQLDDALTHYRRLLVRSPGREIEVRTAIARVTSWQDRLEDALAIYDSVLAESPDNLDARIGRAQATNWSGKHREAAVLYSELLAAHPGNTEIRSGLAQAYRWMDRPDLAMDVLDITPRHASHEEIAGSIQRERSPTVSYAFNSNEDSDDIERRRHEFRGGLSSGYLTRSHAIFSHWKITQPGRPELERDQLRGSLEKRFSTQLALSATAGYEWNQFNRAALGPETFWKDEHNLFTLDGYLTLTPRDWVRADLGLFRGSLDNPEPVFRGITVTELSLGTDYRFRPTMVAFGGGSFADYSDDNNRFTVSGRLTWNPIYQAPVGVRNRFTSSTYVGYLTFDRQLDHGYFSPSEYITLYERLQWDLNFDDVVHLIVAGRIGPEREGSGDWFWVGSMDGLASWQMLRDFSITLGYYNSRSRLETRSGYQADGWYLTLGYLFAR